MCPEAPCAKLVVFYHANAEDIGLAYEFCQDLYRKLECYILIVEYPGYSIYPGEPSEASILADIEPIYNFVVNVMRFERQDLLVMGRSIGSGPATHFASRYQVGGLVLVSGFTSLKCVVKHNFGSLGSSFVKQRFHNEEMIKQVKCPCLFIHGADDALIPAQHSKTLYSRLASPDTCPRPAELLIFSGMTHQYFDIDDCVAMPTQRFLEKVEPIWIRPATAISLHKFALLVPTRLSDFLSGK